MSAHGTFLHHESIQYQTSSVVAQPEYSAPLLSKHTTQQDPETVPSTPILTTYLLKIHFNIILPPSWSTKWPHTKSSSHQNSVFICLPHQSHVPCLLDFSLCKIMKFSFIPTVHTLPFKLLPERKLEQTPLDWKAAYKLWGQTPYDLNTPSLSAQQANRCCEGVSKRFRTLMK
jgi:hypothetical protein